MALSRGEIARPDRGAPVRYVYVKMLEDQADTQEGKLVKGQVLVIPHDKATRWVYRARIARPASKEEFDKFQERMERIASRSGGGVRRRRRGVSFPEEDPFSYVEPETPEWGEAEADNEDMEPEDRPEVRLVGAGGRRSDNLSDRLSNINQDAAEESEEESDEEEDSEFPSPVTSEPEQESGHYTDRIESGPGQTPESARARARARGRNRSDD